MDNDLSGDPSHTRCATFHNELKHRLAAIRDLRAHEYQRRTYGVDMANFINSQNAHLKKIQPDLDLVLLSEKTKTSVFSTYRTLREKFSEFFFRPPKTVAECYGSIVDALDVLLEDRDFLLNWENELDLHIAKCERLRGNEAF